MKNTVDGDKIILNELDGYVKDDTSQNNSVESKLKIELFRLESGSQTWGVIKDILRVKHEAYKTVLLHPVIETYIDIKWKNVKKYILAHFCVYLTFLLTYSWFLANIFYRPLHAHDRYTSVILSRTEPIIFPSILQTSTKEIISRGNNESVVIIGKPNSETQKLPTNWILRFVPDFSFPEISHNSPHIHTTNGEIENISTG